MIKNIFSSFLIAFSFLTRIPVLFINKVEFNKKNVANSLVFFPVVGLFFGIILFFTAKILQYFQASIIIQSAVIIAIPYFLNKFLHFDGLCDVIDAFFSDNKSQEERLKILKDSHIGSFALGGIIIFILLKFSILDSLLIKDNFSKFLLLIPVYSRFSIVLISYKSKYPRENGAGKGIIGEVSLSNIIFSSLFFILFNTGFLLIFNNEIHQTFLIIIIMLVTTIIFSFIFKYFSYKKIGGVTGDVLGALNELIEFLLLLPLSFNIII